MLGCYFCFKCLETLLGPTLNIILVQMKLISDPFNKNMEFRSYGLKKYGWKGRPSKERFGA